MAHPVLVSLLANRRDRILEPSLDEYLSLRSRPLRAEQAAFVRLLARLLGERDPAPDLAAIRHAVPADQACSIGQPDDDVVVQARPFAQLQEIIRPGSLDHRTGADRACGGDGKSEKSSKRRSHHPTLIVFPSL